MTQPKNMESMKKEFEDLIHRIAEMSGVSAEKVKEEIESAESIDDLLIRASEFF